MNKNIKEYRTSSGKKRYKFNVYAGKNKATGQSKIIRKRGFKSKLEAEKSYVSIQKKVKDGEYTSEFEKNLKFKEVYDKWLNFYADTVKESTLATTIRMIEQHVLPELGNLYVDKITVIRCQNAVNKWFKDAPRTLKKYIRYSNSIFKFAEHLELIDSSPMSKVIRPKFKSEIKKFDQYYTKEELKKYLIYAKQYKLKAYAFFRILGYGGLRKGEALALTWGDIDFKNNVINVRSTVSKGLDNRVIIQSPKTYSSARVVAMGKDTMDILKEWQNEQRKTAKIISLNNDGFVFEGIKNGYPTNYPMSATTASMQNDYISKQAKLKHIKLHGFRHTHASLLFEAKVPMQDVKARLGHKSIKTTVDIYTHVTKQQNKEAALSFDHFMRA